MALIIPFEGKAPRVHGDTFVAQNATLIGDVTLDAQSSVWFGAVLRGDLMPIRIGARSNIQDLSMIHTTTDLSSCTVGDDVTVGHRVVLHGCTVGNRVLVGMGSVVLDLAVIEDDVVLGAGSLVTPRTRLPAGHLCLGSPARPVRALHEAERMMIQQGWESYVSLAERYRSIGG